MMAARSVLQTVNNASGLNARTPIDGFLDYLSAIARRDIDGVLDGLVDELAQQMRELRTSADFTIFFELWCESESVPLTITNCWVYRDFAIVEARRGEKLIKTGLILSRRRWLICQEDNGLIKAQAAHLSN